jgi:hypothetical protein
METENQVSENIKKMYVEEELEAVVIFLDGLVNRIVNSTRNVDTQCSVLIALNTTILALSLTAMAQNDRFHLALLCLAVGTTLSAVLALCAVRPPKFLVKDGPEEGLMYTKRIVRYESAKEYSKDLIKILRHDEELFHHYAMEIYNLSKYYYRPKRNLYSISRNIFLLGIIFAVFFVFMELALKTNLLSLFQ